MDRRDFGAECARGRSRARGRGRGRGRRGSYPAPSPPARSPTFEEEARFRAEKEAQLDAEKVKLLLGSN